MVSALYYSPIRPLIYQQRRKAKFVGKTAENDDNVFFNKEYILRRRLSRERWFRLLADGIRIGWQHRRLKSELTLRREGTT